MWSKIFITCSRIITTRANGFGMSGDCGCFARLCEIFARGMMFWCRITGRAMMQASYKRMSKTQRKFKRDGVDRTEAFEEGRKAEVEERLSRYRQRSSILFRPSHLDPQKLLGASANGHQLVDRGAIAAEIRKFAVESHPDYPKIVLGLINGEGLEDLVALYSKPSEGHDLLLSDLTEFRDLRLQPAVTKLVHESVQTIGSIASLEYYAARLQVKEQRLAEAMDRAAAEDDFMALAAMDRVDTANLEVMAKLTGQLDQKTSDNRTAVIVMPALEADSLAPRRTAIVGLPKTEPGVGMSALDLLSQPITAEIVEAEPLASGGSMPSFEIPPEGVSNA